MREEKSSGLSMVVVVLTVVIVAISALLVLVILRLAVTLNDSAAFAPGTTVNGLEVSGLTASEAEEQINKLAENYVLQVRFADGEYTLQGKDIALKVGANNSLRRLVKDQDAERIGSAVGSQRGQELWDEELLSYDALQLHQTVSDWPSLSSLKDMKSKDARLEYSEEMGKFKIKKESPGGAVDQDVLEQKINDCVLGLTKKLDVVEEGLYGSVRTADSPEMQAALSDANEKLHLKITYRYEVKDANISGKETVGFDQLSKWLYVTSDGMSVGVDSHRLQNYVSEMSRLYSAKGSSSGGNAVFLSSTGIQVEVDAPAQGESVDTDELFNDIVSCVDSKTSGKRDAPYIKGTTDLGGSYVEVDLDGQHLWLYKDHELVTEGDICSGDVATGCETPTGLYTIKDKQTDRWLNGEDYHDWVSYWMPFNGGVGLHDSTWRSDEDYGGEVYLENGSHGCINMPLDLADAVYENVQEGTYVVLYGGVTSSAENAQIITGESSYHKSVGDGAFELELKTNGDSKLSYASSNVQVAKVDSTGKVTITGPGKAIIRVTAPATEKYRRATKDITITVK